MTTESRAVTAAPKKPPLIAGRTVHAIIPQDFEQAYRLATVIAAAGWAPKSYLINPRRTDEGFDVNKITIGILHGMEVGLPPMAALQSIAVINGTPNLWGDGALAVVRASGLLVDIEEWEEKTDEGLTAHCRVFRAGERSETLRTFSEADAKKGGLVGKEGPWSNYPRRMRQMRARGFALRDAFADVLRGMGMAEETLDGGDLIQTADGTYIPATSRPARSDFQDRAATQTVDTETGEVSDADPTTADILPLIESAPSVSALMELWTGLPSEITDDDALFAAYEAKRDELSAQATE